jgi:proton-coupled amino acid transporter
MTVEVDPSAGSSKVRIVANIFISFIGAGVLGLPYAFKEAGLMEGAIVMSGVCYLSVKAMLLLIDCKYKVEEGMAKDNNGGGKKAAVPAAKMSNGKEYVQLAVEDDGAQDGGIGVKSGGGGSSGGGNNKKQITYSDVGFAAFGPLGRVVIDTALLVSQVGFCCAYLIFISENLATVIHGLSQHQWLIIILPPLFFLTLIPDLSNLAIFSLFAQISNLFAFAVVFWFDFDHLHLASPEHRKEFSITGFPFFFSVAIYCFEGAGMILSLEQSVCEALRPLFRSYFVTTIISVTVLYITFGCFGFLSFGPETRDIITLNLPHNSGVDFAVIVKSCLCFSLFFTYPIMMFPVTSLLEERLLNQPSRLYANLIRVGLVAATGITVILVPRFADLMALVGSTCCTLLAFIMPGLCHLILFGKSSDAQARRLDYVLIGTGVIGAILGTYDAIVNILQH